MSIKKMNAELQKLSKDTLTFMLRKGKRKNYESGETGIRTLETLLTFTHFPGVPLQPLEHLSVFLWSAKIILFNKYSIVYYVFFVSLQNNKRLNKLIKC